MRLEFVLSWKKSPCHDRTRPRRSYQPPNPTGLDPKTGIDSQPYHKKYAAYLRRLSLFYFHAHHACAVHRQRLLHGLCFFELNQSVALTNSNFMRVGSSTENEHLVFGELVAPNYEDRQENGRISTTKKAEVRQTYQQSRNKTTQLPNGHQHCVVVRRILRGSEQLGARQPPTFQKPNIQTPITPRAYTNGAISGSHATLIESQPQPCTLRPQP